MKRALALVSVVWLSGACSSDGGGGNDGSANGGSGASVAPDGSGAGANPAGSGSQSPVIAPLTVESISPEDDDSAVPLDAVIEVRFSAALDPATATASSVVVQGPNGPLQGELTVEGESLRFTPASELPLLTSVRISLGVALASIEGGALAEPIEAEFRSRDGVFREPQQINAGAAASLFLRGNDAGDLIATWTDLQVRSSVEAMLFDAELGTWTQAQRIENDEQLAFSRPVAAMASNGDSIVAWQGGGWTRYAGEWSTAIVGQGIAFPNVALGASGALSVTNAMGGASYQLLPSAANEWSAAQALLMGGRVDAIDAFAGGFIAVGSREGELVAGQRSEPEGVWSEFVSLGTLEQLQRVRLSTHGNAAAVAWVDLGEAPSDGDNLNPVTRPAARVFAGDSWSTPLELPEGAELPWVSVAAGGRALAVWTRGNAISASAYSTEQGWTEPQELAEQSQLTPTGAVDGSGNLMALWPSSQEIFVHRRVAGGEWQALEPLDSQVTVTLWSHVDQQGRVNLVWQNGSGIWWTRFE
jgi:Big-like domain-containing protein